MGLRDEETTKQTIVDTSRYRRGPCHECEGSSWTLLLCVPDKGQFVELNIFHRNRTCFQRVLRKQQLWGKKLQNGRCPYWPFQNWKSWVYSVLKAFIWKCKLTVIKRLKWSDIKWNTSKLYRSLLQLNRKHAFNFQFMKNVTFKLLSPICVEYFLLIGTIFLSGKKPICFALIPAVTLLSHISVLQICMHWVAFQWEIREDGIQELHLLF